MINKCSIVLQTEVCRHLSCNHLSIVNVILMTNNPNKYIIRSIDLLIHLYLELLLLVVFD